jgi:GntR family transcriptional regulator
MTVPDRQEDKVKIIISNSSPLPIYEQIKQQVKAAILSGELKENEPLPSLRELAKDLKISVLTTMRAYNELEQEGFVTSIQGKGYYVMPRGSQLMQEQFLREVERALEEAVKAAALANISGEQLMEMLKLLLEVE